MLVPMAKVEIVGLKSDLARVLSVVHRLGALDVRPQAPPSPLETPTMRLVCVDREQVERVERVVERLGTLVGLLAAPPRPSAAVTEEASNQTTPEVLAYAEELLATVEPASQAGASRRTALEAELGALRQHRDVMRRLLPIAESIVDLEGFETVALVVQPQYRHVVDTLREELASVTRQQCEVIATESPDGGIAVLLVFNRRFAADVHGLLSHEQLVEVRLPSQYRGRPLRGALAEIARREDEIPRELTNLADDLSAALSPVAGPLAAYRAALLDRLDELRVAGSCLETDYTFALGGWLPDRDVPRLERALQHALAGRVLLRRLPFSRADWDEMPVLLENPRLVRPFEVLLRLLPAPRYGTIDPTPFLAFFFPFFFGLIVGDVGYGLVLLGLALWIQRRGTGPPWMQQGARVIAMGSLVAVAFGLAFGEFFGSFGQAFGLRPLVAARRDAIPPLLLFSVGVGAVQVGLGLVLGAVNEYLERHRKEMLSHIETLAALVAVFGLVGVAADLLPGGLLTPGIALLAAATALLVYSVGLLGPLEVVGVLGNVLSYTRLVAVGLASAILADVANQMAGRTESVLLGVIVGALFHGLNFALGLLSPSIQSLRLQYVEFFGRFFQPGGRPYAPFQRRAVACGDRGVPV